MKKQLLALGLSVTLSAFIATSSAHAAGFSDGGFDSTQVNGALATYGNGSQIGSWTVTGDSIDLIGNYWASTSGQNSLDLSGGDAGGVTQTFSTIAGQAYKVSFDMSGNFDSSASQRSLSASAGDFSKTFSFSKPTDWSHESMNWQTNDFTFVADKTGSTTLSFASLDNGAYGPTLDSVSVNAVPTPAPAPEPSSLILGLMSLGGIFGFKRKQK